MSYLSVPEARTAFGGLDMTGLGDVELQAYIDESCDLVDQYTHNRWGYQEVGSEQHSWSADSLKVWTYNSPVRVIRSYKLLNAAWAGNEIAWSLDTSEVVPTGDAHVLPNTFGDVQLDRSVDEFNASPLIVTGQLISLVASFGIRLEIAYTSGFDDGTVQSDGYSMPYPSWLKTATQIILRQKLERWFRNYRYGMAGLLEVRVSDTMYRMPQSRASIGDQPVIPADAKRILDGVLIPWVA